MKPLPIDHLDRAFIKRCLSVVLDQHHDRLLREYHSDFTQAYDAEPIEYKKINAGRKYANSNLLSKISKK